MPSLGIAFLKKVLPGKLRKQLDLDKLTVEKPKFRDKRFRETRPDMVYKVPILGTGDCVSFYIIIEHKSFDDHSAIYQVWQYIGQLCFQDVEKRLTNPKTKKRRNWPKNFQLSPIIPIIIHHGSQPFTGATQLVKLFYPLPGAEEYLPHLQAILVDLSTMEDDQLPRDANAPELHVVLLMMKVIFSKDVKTLKHRFNAIFDELLPYSQNPRYYELIRKLWYYTLHNTKDLTRQDYHDLESVVRDTLGDKQMPTILQVAYKDGIKKGEAKGMAKAILELLLDRFGEVPQATQDAVTAITDLVELRRLTLLAAKCKSMAAFAKAMK
jgi:hypothetical protein